MKLGRLLADHVRQLYHGKNWTTVTLTDALQDLTLSEVNEKIGDHNSIGTLLYHMHYYVKVQLLVLKGGPLQGNDKDSFNGPAISSDQQLHEFSQEIMKCGDEYAALVEQLSNEDLLDAFGEEKYGTKYRNIQGFIEHTHYHLGQVILLRKLIKQ